jgi:hypothetical protein
MDKHGFKLVFQNGKALGIHPVAGLGEHDAKSFVGKAFRHEAVKSVVVFDDTGFVPLYLKKTENGVVREEN